LGHDMQGEPLQLKTDSPSWALAPYSSPVGSGQKRSFPGIFWSLQKAYAVTYYILIGVLWTILLPLPVSAAPEIKGELYSGFDYIHIKKDCPFPLESQVSSANSLELKASGLLSGDGWQFSLGVKSGQNEEDDFLSGLTLDELQLSTLFDLQGKSILVEIGKQDWQWGKCFSRIPTYPLPEENFYGMQWTLTTENRHLIIGLSAPAATPQAESKTMKEQIMRLTSHDTDPLSAERNITAWVRRGGFLASSDYDLVFSYQSRTKDSTIPACYNLGLDTSKDFLNGLEMHGSLNLRHTPKSKGMDSKTQVDCVIGGEYIWGAKTIICEVLSESDSKDTSLVWAVNNYSSFFSNYQWGLESYWNLRDDGRFLRLLLEYTGLRSLAPSLELTLFAGPEKSAIGASPVDLMVSLGMRAVL